MHRLLLKGATGSVSDARPSPASLFFGDCSMRTRNTLHNQMLLKIRESKRVASHSCAGVDAIVDEGRSLHIAR